MVRPLPHAGPILEKVIDETEGRVVLTKVNIDENPGIAQSFQVQSIPLVIALKDGQPVDGFLGAYPEQEVRAFVDRLLPTEEESEVAGLVEAGDEVSLRRALELDPDNEAAVVGLAEVLVERGEHEEALQVLGRIPETAEVRRVAAMARLGDDAPAEDGYDAKLSALLDQVKDDETARQEFVDLLELMGPDDPRTAQYRRQLTSRLF